jgi:hypothetical protein
MPSSNEAARPVKRLASLTLVLSIFFWSWALYNTLAKPYGLDYGVISFLLTAITSFALLLSLNTSPPHIRPSAPPALLASCLVVSANYVLGAVAALNGGGGGEGGGDDAYLLRYAIYCCIFSFLWLSWGVFLFRRLSWERQADLDDGAESFDDQAAYTRIRDQ